jgi:hypothetical protein
MSNTFVTPKAVTTIAQSRINYNDSVTSLLDNFSSTGAPGPTNISIEGTTGLRTGMLWYKSGTDTSEGQGRLFVYNGTEFTRNGLNTYKVPSIGAANSAVVAGSISYGELVLVGTDSLYIVNAANTGIVPLTVGGASDADTLDGLDSTQFLRSDVADSTSGKLTVSNTLSVTQNVGIGVTNPTVPLAIAKDEVIVSLNDTNGSLGGSVDSYVTFQASGSNQGDVGFKSTSQGIMTVANRQGDLLLQADTNNAKTNSNVTIAVDGTSVIKVTSTLTTVNGNFTSTGNINTSSDSRLKDNVSQLYGAVETVKQLRGVSFTKKDSNTNSIGLIAQEVETILPDLVSNDGEFKAVAYQNIVALLIEAIKEQQQQIERLQSGR